MRHASQKRSSSVPATSPTPSAHSAPLQPPVNSALATREFGGSSPACGSATTEVRLSPAGTFVAGVTSSSDAQVRRCRELAIAIRQRIESRLAGRVRDLTVRVMGDTIVLEGRCATYYTKQLAQHAALGVLDDEQLENAIVVGVPR